MQRRIEPEFEHWRPLVTVRKAVRQAIEGMAREDQRSTATTIGILLEKAVTARSSA